jgi:16S rRNA (adenine1518-N6/adenine1519-N6)-dimethyltransferase
VQPPVQTLSHIKSLLAARGIAPRHAFGQNFLHDHNQIRKLVDRSGISPGDTVLEVGPGTGALTVALIAAGARVIAAELDRDMCAIATSEAARAVELPRPSGAPAAHEAFTLVEGDCLASKHSLSPALAAALGDRPFTLVANLPYHAATPLMLNLLCDWPTCRGQFITIQRDVADRLMAKPSTDAYGALSVMATMLAHVSMISVLPPGCFWPAPKVTSAMVAIEPHRPRPAIDTHHLSAFLQRVFSMRRKQLGRILGDAVAWPEGITRTMRPEQLSPELLLELSRRAPAPESGPTAPPA